MDGIAAFTNLFPRLFPPLKQSIGVILDFFNLAFVFYGLNGFCISQACVYFMFKSACSLTCQYFKHHFWCDLFNRVCVIVHYRVFLPRCFSSFNFIV